MVRRLVEERKSVGKDNYAVGGAAYWLEGMGGVGAGASFKWGCM